MKVDEAVSVEFYAADDGEPSTAPTPVGAPDGTAGQQCRTAPAQEQGAEGTSAAATAPPPPPAEEE